MKQLPKKNSIWLYVGKGPGRAMPHMVLEVDKKEKTVVTWSSFDENPKNGGFTWFGPIVDFFDNFNPTEPVAS